MPSNNIPDCVQFYTSAIMFVISLSLIIIIMCNCLLELIDLKHYITGCFWFIAVQYCYCFVTWINMSTFHWTKETTRSRMSQYNHQQIHLVFFVLSLYCIFLYINIYLILLQSRNLLHAHTWRIILFMKLILETLHSLS